MVYVILPRQLEEGRTRAITLQLPHVGAQAQQGTE